MRNKAIQCENIPKLEYISRLHSRQQFVKSIERLINISWKVYFILAQFPVAVYYVSDLVHEKNMFDAERVFKWQKKSYVSDTPRIFLRTRATSKKGSNKRFDLITYLERIFHAIFSRAIDDNMLRRLIRSDI